jgi:two-component system, NarL family, sensor histidine kinase DegS
MTDAPATTPSTAPVSLAELTARLAEEVARLERELEEVDLLVTQAKAEAARHESRRSAASDKLTALTKDAQTDEVTELSVQLVTLTKRAALMESQVEVLEGKRGAMARHRDTMAAYAEMAAGVDPAGQAPSAVPRGTASGPSPEGEAVPKMLLSAQEDLRRELARAMHDGPAQSLTNIVLQAQIAERLVGKDPALAQVEIRQLVNMVQQTLEATKTFIFDVRPMVLDDLGLVPTLRRATRERGKRAGLTVDFETLGQDRRLPMEMESGLFRILDEALVAYRERAPDQVSMQLDWSEVLVARVHATRTAKSGPAVEAEAAVPSSADLPPALAAMVEDRRAAARDAVETARRESIVSLPPTAWREIQSRAATIGVTAELLSEGSELQIVAQLPAAADG